MRLNRDLLRSGCLFQGTQLCMSQQPRWEMKVCSGEWCACATIHTAIHSIRGPWTALKVWGKTRWTFETSCE
jgi:hypothetical protein